MVQAGERRPAVDVEAVLFDRSRRSSCRRSPHRERRVRGPRWRLAPAARLLDVDVVALVIAWRREHNVYRYDAAGRCIGIARTREPAPTVGWTTSRSTSWIREGHWFSLGTWSSQATSLIGGLTAARATANGAVLGIFDERSSGTLRDGDGQLIGLARSEKIGRWRRQEIGVEEPDGDSSRAMRTVRSHRKTLSGRRADFVSVVEFSPVATHGIRALTLAGEICHVVQRQKHAQWGD